MALKKAKNTASTKGSAASTPLIYVTRDIERAVGRVPGDSYFILTNSTPYSREWQEKYPNSVFLIDGNKNPGEILDTYDLLEQGANVIEKIKTESKTGEVATVNIVVFKNTSRIEEFCIQKKWNLLNPPAELAEKIENKVTQAAWLGEGRTTKNNPARYLPPHAVLKVSEIDQKLAQFKKIGIAAPFMIQWAHSHTGDGTIFIDTGKMGEKTLDDLRKKFPERQARVTAFIKGPVFTANICVSTDNDTNTNKSTVIVGNISLQITGIPPFTDNPWTTIGNDWSIPHDTLNENRIEDIRTIAREVGERIREGGWTGLFGIDCIYDAERDVMHLLEINARQAASTTFESQLQEKLRAQAPGHFKNQITIFEAHLAALQKQAISSQLIEINDGAQIILRIPGGTTKESAELRKTEAEIIEIYEELTAKNYTIIEYQNTKPNSDLLRIQSDRGIMESLTKFNSRGAEIRDIISSDLFT